MELTSVRNGNGYGNVIDSQWVQNNYHGEKDFVIPEGYIAITDDAFRQGYGKPTNNLERLTVSDGILEIGKGAFYECSNLKEIVLPDSLRVINDFAFVRCESLKNIRFSENMYILGDCSLDGCKSLSHVTLPDNLSVIGREAFNNCTSLKEIRLPEGLSSVAPGAFCGCTSLESVHLPSKVHNIAYQAFYGCSSLQKINLSDVNSIEYDAFSECTALDSIDLSGVSKIGHGAFKKCSVLSTIDLCNATLIEKDAFSCCSALKDVKPGEKLAEISERCFAECKSLEHIIIPDSITNIESFAFYNCNKLYDVTLPKNIQELGHWVFSGTEFEKRIPYLVKDNCVYRVLKPSEIEIPEGITKIDSDAFGYAHEYVSLPSTLKEFDGKIKSEYVDIKCDLDVFAPDAFWNKTIIGLVIENCIPVKLQLQNHWLETNAEIAVKEFLAEPSLEKFNAINNSDYKITLAIAFGMSQNCNEYESYQNYLRKVGYKAIVKMIDDKNYDALYFYIEANKFTPKACETGIEYAIETEDRQAYIVLAQYKHNHKGYNKDPMSKFNF